MRVIKEISIETKVGAVKVQIEESGRVSVHGAETVEIATPVSGSFGKFVLKNGIAENGPLLLVRTQVVDGRVQVTMLTMSKRVDRAKPGARKVLSARVKQHPTELGEAFNLMFCDMVTIECHAGLEDAVNIPLGTLTFPARTITYLEE